MKDRTATTSKYGFITVVFLVLTLSCLIFLISSYNKDSDKLDSTVNNLSRTNSDEEKIDSALALLYISENNARMFSLYNDTAYYKAYRDEIQGVKTLIDSLQMNNSDNAFGEMVADKEFKTKMFLEAQALVDSILLNNNDSAVIAENSNAINYPVPKFHSVKHLSADTTVVTQVAQKKKKGFMRRVSEAIFNIQDSSAAVVNNVVINSYRKDSVKMNYENRSLQSQLSNIRDHQKALENLKKKEREVLEANHNLFMNLQGLLQELKKQEAKIRDKRNTLLSRNAFSLTKNLKISNRYISIFSIALSAVILIILFVLYKNELALKKAKVQAENYAKLKSEFTATMSHEIRTPLHSIHAFADELNVQDNKQHQSEIIDAIKLSARMLLSVVNNILDFTKIEKGKFKLENVDFNPKDIVNEILSGLRIQAKQKSLDLSGKIDPSADKMLKGDAFHLRQILLNILSNALKYTDAGSVIISAKTVARSPQKTLLQLTVSDTGTGIAKENIPHLFDEFSSNEHKEEVVSGSTGLGLNIVKKLVDLHKGTISVTSELNKGTVFTIEIPYDNADGKEYIGNAAALAENNSSVNGSGSIQKTEPESTGKLKVLLVENDTFNQKFLSQLFAKHGTLLDVVSSAEEALKTLSEKKFDVILTDIGLPKMNGTELAKTIKTGSGINAATIVFGISGFEQNHAEDNIRYFDEWLVKPFKSQELIDRIHKYFPQKNVSLT